MISLAQQHLKITFLGTGTSQGIPVIGSTHPVCLSDDPRDKRLRVSALVQWDHYNYVIDCGPDFREQMLRTLSRKQEVLHGILFTHEHADHVAGLDDIRPFVFKQGDLPIYGNKRVLDTLQYRFEYVFATKDRYPGAPKVQINEVKESQSFTLNNLEVIPIKAHHGSLPIFGYRFGQLAYLTDVKTIPEAEMQKLQDLELLVINALRYEQHQSHLTVDEALDLVHQLQPKTTYFTHISHTMGFHEEVEKKLPNNVFLAYDGLTVRLP